MYSKCKIHTGFQALSLKEEYKICFFDFFHVTIRKFKIMQVTCICSLRDTSVGTVLVYVTF